MDVKIRALQAGDRAAWGKLYAAYADFYEVTQTEEMRERVWGWMMEPAHEVEGLVAERGDALVGLAHFRGFARPLAAATGGFLDDLFVNPEARGLQVGGALIAELETIAKARGWSVIRWITADDNFRARGLYDRIATRTMWVTYDMSVGGADA